MKLFSLLFSFFLYTMFSASSLAAEVVSHVSSSSVSTSAVSTTANTTINSAPGNLLQIIVSLIVVVGLLIAFAVVFKKFGLNRLHATFPVKIIGAISVGNNQRIMVIEAGDEWVVLGVTPQNISPLTSMPRQENNNDHTVNPGNSVTNAGKPNFSTWMQSTLEKYRANKQT